MRWPESVLLEDEEVVVHVHPHWATVLRPVAGLLVLVGTASFAAGAIPAGPRQATLRLVVAGVAVALILVSVVRPVLRWAATHTVLTTHRLLMRSGPLARQTRDVALDRVVEVSVHRTSAQRLLGSGTVVVTCAGQGAPTMVERVARAERFRRLLDELLDELDHQCGDEVGGRFDRWGSRVH